MDWCGFLEEEIRKRSSRRGQTWRILAYSLAFTGAAGWYLLWHPVVLSPEGRALAVGAGGLAFLVATIFIGRITSDIQTAAVSVDEQALTPKRVHTFLLKATRRTAFHWPTLPHAMACVLSAFLLGTWAVEIWPDWWAVLLWIAVGFFALSAIALLTLHEVARAFRHAISEPGAFADEEAPDLSKGRGRLARLKRGLGWGPYHMGHYWMLAYSLIGFVVLAVWTVSEGILDAGLVSESVTIGSASALVFFGLISLSLFIDAYRDNSVALLERLRYARLLGDQVGFGPRLDDRDVADAFLVLELLRADGRLSNLAFDDLLRHASEYRRLVGPR